MAGTSPTRRSSRARTNQPQSQHSSASSNASGRVDRSTRAFAQAGSPQKSTESGSLSSESPEESIATDDIILRRRSTRGKDNDREEQLKEAINMGNGSDENPEDDEAVRCVCGYDEYPGPPPIEIDLKQDPKDSIDDVFAPPANISEELAGFFIQCNICNVWQHGGCVGIFSEKDSPEEYFCEQCRKDLHKVYTASNGQRYSKYNLHHQRQSRTTSRATSTAKDGTKSPKGRDRKSDRNLTAAQHAKRRSTMNSRDAAYDEEEQIRRAIEASKEDAPGDLAEIITRRTKRVRDDSEDKLENVKRQRTNSRSPSPEDKAQSDNAEESEDDNGRNGTKRSRNAARTQKEKAERDERREEQERKRAEAASKRKGRAERRRADDSDPAEEPAPIPKTVATRATESVQPPDPPSAPQQAPDTPPANAAQSAILLKRKESSRHKKKGRNQYTKDRDAQEHEGSPARSMSRDVNKDENGGASHSYSKTSGHDTGRQGHGNKAKGGMSSRVTMSDMKRRANAIMDFITRTQVDLAESLGETPSNSSHQSPKDSATDEGSSVNGVPVIRVNGDGNPKKPEESGVSSKASGSLDPSKEFHEMTCVEMMDVLSRDLVKWQQEYAV